MLDRDLARLAAIAPDERLAGLEQAVWARVEESKRFQRFERVTSRAQLVALGAALMASTAVGVAIAQPPGRGQAVLQISSAAADLAPSSLLGAPR